MKKTLSLVICLFIFVIGSIAFDTASVDASGVIRNNRNGIVCPNLYGEILSTINPCGRRRTFTRREAASVRRLGAPFEVTSLQGIHLLPNLRTFNFQLPHFRVTSEFTSGDLRPLGRLRYLTDLRITVIGNDRDISNELPVPRVLNLRGIRTITSLRRLEVTSAIPQLGSLRSLSGIESLTNLRVLNVSGNRLTNLDGIQNLRNLTHINASNNRITNANGIRRLPRLRRVNLSNNNLRQIPNLTNRRTLTTSRPNSFGLDFSNNRLSETQFRTKLPTRIRNMQNGRWLQRQLASQNS